MMSFFRRFKDLKVEGPQAHYYDETTRTHRMEEMQEEAREVSRYLKDGDEVLEVASGPGYLSIELAKQGKYKITGMDLSKDFVEIAARNAKRAGVEVNFIQGNASELPFKDHIFHFIVCVLSFKNFKDPQKVLEEMYRVLKPGGLVLIMDLNRNASRQAMKAFVKSFGLKGFSAFVARIMQTNGAYTRKEFEAFIAQSAFKKGDIKDTRMGLSVYLRK
jgi:ubiquinone/menaquinone biosynthesis C-methylase UbiE